ncbi:MAG: SDR family oxidoreductase [Rhodospirillaceae bacterium]|nr:SDR family oxidoreductase [Rhodospirillaceae bacterium]MBT5194360.1 SDR family oxidoreductase [Rhodospirillaceae bacterium]MBT5896963.1 SDR family oxidoreductase [Rhodospirillaceae bacterium]MBT6431286.1 SDR family oxidoreductase [Rhodospirillaceae bacterium]MBT6675499.1 SDR family oxidoreductase [Rhodospirillaceae bacterium]
MAKELSGRRVLITAGGSGIGRTMAGAFHQAGARIAICDVDGAALEQTARELPGVTAVIADVADAGDVDAMFTKAEDALGGLDVLVNNAGIAGPTGLLEDLSLDDWRRCLAVNLDGHFHCLRRAVPLMKAQGAGCIINLSSSAGILGLPNRTPYTASKWAVVGLTKSLAMEVGPFGIRVNAIAPGSVEGDRMDRVIAAEAAASGHSEAAIREDYVRTVSMRTFVTAEDVAAMAIFLASDAGAKISGQVISVDGHTEALGGPY